MLKDAAPKQSSTHSTGSTPASAIAEIPVKPRRNYGVHRCDWFIAELGLPEPLRTVIAWRTASQLPCAAFFDAEENCWTSASDGARLDDVTDWMYYLTPDGAESGRLDQLVSAMDGNGDADKALGLRIAEQTADITIAVMDADVLNTQIIDLLEEFEYREQDKGRIDALYTFTRAIGNSLAVIKQRNTELEQHAFPSVGSTGDLTPDEQQLVSEYRKMDDRARELCVRDAERAAEDWPRDFVTITAELEEAQQGVSAHAGESE